MVQHLDRIRVSQNDAVVSTVNEDNTVEVVYNSDDGMVVYEDAKLVDGKWVFVESGPNAGYARGKERLQEAVAKLNMSPELRHRLEHSRQQGR